jgi:hypothetical protein
MADRTRYLSQFQSREINAARLPTERLRASYSASRAFYGQGAKNRQSLCVGLCAAVWGFKCKEYVHVLNPKRRPHLILYRTKDKAKSLEQSSEVTGKVYAQKKVLFAGRQFPVASKLEVSFK